jgi:NitT/TauT family transport system substrate-binding protein
MLQKERPVAIRNRLVAVAMAGALLLAACTAEPGTNGSDGSDAALPKIQIASAPNVFLSALYVAQEKGYFTEEGVEVEVVEIQAGTDSVAALVSGNAQVADVGFDDLLELASEGEEGLIMVQNILNRVTLTMVMDPDIAAQKGVSRDSSLDEIYASLEGLRIGITSPGAPTDKYMRYYLRQAGLDPDQDAEILPLGGGSDLLAALESKQIDVFHLSPPPPYVAEAEGFGVVLIDGPAGDVDEFSDFLYTAWAANEEWATANPDAMKAFNAALDKAMSDISADPAAVVETVATGVGSDDLEITERVLTALLPAMSTDGCFTDEAVRTSLDIMFDTEIIEEEGDSTEGVFWTNDYNGCE